MIKSSPAGLFRWEKRWPRRMKASLTEPMEVSSRDSSLEYSHNLQFRSPSVLCISFSSASEITKISSPSSQITKSNCCRISLSSRILMSPTILSRSPPTPNRQSTNLPAYLMSQGIILRTTSMSSSSQMLTESSRAYAISSQTRMISLLIPYKCKMQSVT